jgi:hypothetical protein
MGFYKARKDFQPLILKKCKVVFDAIRQLFTPPKEPRKIKGGFGVTYRVMAFIKRKERLDTCDVGTNFNPFSLKQ